MLIKIKSTERNLGQKFTFFIDNVIFISFKLVIFLIGTMILYYEHEIMMYK